MIITTNITSKNRNLCLPLVIIFCLLFLSLFNVRDVFGQKGSNTDRASISATIIRSIGITKTNDFNIRSSAISTPSENILSKLDISGEIRNSRYLNISEATVNPASFVVTGGDTYMYSITLPTSVYKPNTILDSQSMLITNFNSSSIGSRKLISRSQTIFVSATVNISTSNVVDLNEDNRDFEIIVNYN